NIVVPNSLIKDPVVLPTRSGGAISGWSFCARAGILFSPFSRRGCQCCGQFNLLCPLKTTVRDASLFSTLILSPTFVTSPTITTRRSSAEYPFSQDTLFPSRDILFPPQDSLFSLKTLFSPSRV